MGRRLRYLPEGAMVEITCRTVQERFLLRPSPRFNLIALGVLGRAQAMYEMAIHQFVILSNHLHLLLSPDTPKQLAAFMGFFEANLAKEVGRLHQWDGAIWQRRYQSIPVSDEEEAQQERLFYLLRQGVKEHLVGRPQDWPGPHGTGALLEGQPLEGVWIDRTLEHRLRRNQPNPDPRSFEFPVQVLLTPLPCWRDLSPDQRRSRIDELVKEVENEGLKLARELGPPLGAARVLRQHPHQRQTRSKRSPAPFVHAATRAARAAMNAAYRLFVAAYRRAAELLRGGDRTVRFPERAFPPPLPADG